MLKRQSGYFFNAKLRGRRSGFKTKTLTGQFGLSTFYKNHFFLMRSF